MKNLNAYLKGKLSNPKKWSLIRILYVYPIIFFLIGLSTIIAYYTWLQINKYNKQVEKLKIEFPEKQRNELKSKVLLAKDYIFWVKSHPDEFIKFHLNRRINETENIVYTLPDTLKAIPDAVIEKLDQLNKQSESKIIILNSENELL